MPREKIYARLQHAGVPWRELERKRIFFTFALLALFLIVVGGFLAAYLIWPRLAQFHPLLPLAAAVLIAGFITIVGLVLLLMVLSAALERDLRFHWGERVGLLWLLPLAVALGKVFRVPKDRVRNSFVNVNNALVRAVPRMTPPEQILVLLPRCMQHSECPYRVTEDVRACHGCGRCPLAQLIELQDRYGFAMRLVTGGSLARRQVKEIQPRGIVAVACEYEMVAGVEDVLKIPVIGVLNERPEGPCKNTRVDVAEVEAAVRFFLGSRQEARAASDGRRGTPPQGDGPSEREVVTPPPIPPQGSPSGPA